MKTLIIITVMLFSDALYGESMTIVELQRAALASNPRLMAMDAEAQMMKKRIPQSLALEDPKLKLGVNNLSAKTLSYPRQYISSRDIDPSQVVIGKGYTEMIPAVEIGVSQMIPLGKLGFRKKVAKKEHERSTVKFRAEKVEILHMLRMNYYDLMYARASMKILDDIKKQIKLIIDSEIAATKSGMGSLANVVKAKIEYNMVDEEVINLRQKRKELEQNINYLLGKKVEITEEALPAPAFKEVEVEAVRNEILTSNPQLKILSLDAEISRSEISLKKSEYAPDLDVGFSYMRQWDGAKGKMNEVMLGMGGATPVYKTERMRQDDMVSFMVTLNIPFWFWNKNIPMVDEMKKKNEAAKSLYQDRLNEMNARAEILAGQLVKWSDLYRLYHDRLIPQSELAFETTLARYRTGSGEFMPVVDTVRMLLRYKKDLIMSVKEYYASYSELNALMGVEVLQ
jgi:cobalt-zinc-cadmium efflux system outer membrane protein